MDKQSIILTEYQNIQTLLSSKIPYKQIQKIISEKYKINNHNDYLKYFLEKIENNNLFLKNSDSIIFISGHEIELLLNNEILDYIVTTIPGMGVLNKGFVDIFPILKNKTMQIQKTDVAGLLSIEQKYFFKYYYNLYDLVIPNSKLNDYQAEFIHNVKIDFGNMLKKIITNANNKMIEFVMKNDV